MRMKKWNYDLCKSYALKCKTKKDFKTKYSSAYYAACRHKWLESFVWFEKLNTPQNYWTYKRCYEEAKKYKCRSDFQKGKIGAYKASLKNGWLKNYEWMHTPVSKRKKWNYETCYNEAKKYETLKEFRLNAPYAVLCAKKYGWFKEYGWLKNKAKPRGYWTYERCYEEAKKYKTKKEFRNNNDSCYCVAVKNRWIDDYTWLPKRKKVLSKWSKELCFEIGHKYRTKKDFEKNDKGCYIASLRCGWLKEMDWFEPAVIEPMDRFKKSHCVYVYKDDEMNVAYVGLTSNLKIRHSRHKKCGTVFKYFSLHNRFIPQPIVLKNNLTPEESRYYEDYYLQEFKNKGYNILNKGCTGRYCGSFGGGRVIYTKQKCYEIAKQYEHKIDFLKGNPSCYNRAYKMGWLAEYKWLKTVRDK